ncbi:MAG: glycosyltransferase family 2 protein [Candidatus Riflebacteria bacterium]|nr:glycosyltransferase family 2 protein [Candidatus Riflebacteria bacterium]
MHTHSLNISHKIPSRHARVTVVIPCFKAKDTICQVIKKIPDFVDRIIVVDDKCPQGSGKAVEALLSSRITLVRHEQNQGVGGAMISGYKKALEIGTDIVVKLDADGQMDPEDIARLIRPLLLEEADYTKGNRFTDFRALKSMPSIRLLGNSALSFLLKAASGYWNIMDPTNGFTAIRAETLQRIDLSKIAKDYFFESSMLIALNLQNAIVADVNMPARYFGEHSSLNIRRSLITFPPRLLTGLLERGLLKYFVYDFNMASLYFFLGIPMLFISSFWGIMEWIDSIRTRRARPAGTIMLVALPIILGFQMILQAIGIDIYSNPSRIPRTKV